MATSRTDARADVIIEVLEDAFAPLIRADPVAFRAKYRKMAADPLAFYRGSACLFYGDVIGGGGPLDRPAVRAGSGSTATCTWRTSAPTSTPTAG